MEVHIEEAFNIHVLDCTEETVGPIVFSEEIESTSSYVSSVFAGSTSDRQIVERSKLFNMCDPIDSIMAD